MSKHAAPRVPGRLGPARRQFTADPWGSLLLGLLVALITCAATAWPRFILDMNSAQVPHQVNALSATQRDLSAHWSAALTPTPDRTYESAEDTWGSVLEGMERTRQAQPEPLRSMLQDGEFYIDLGRNDQDIQPPEGTDYSTVFVQERIDPLLEQHVELVSGSWPEVVINPSPQLPEEAIGEGHASGPAQVVILDEAAQELNLSAGDAFEDYLITGTYTPTDPDHPRWSHQTNSKEMGSIFSGDAGLMAYLTAYLSPASPGSTGPITNNAMHLYYPLDGSEVRGDQVNAVTAQLIGMTSTQQDLRLPDSEEGFNTNFNDPGVNLAEPPIQVTFGTEVLSEFQALANQQRATASILAVVVAGPVGVALAVFALAARLITSRRQPTLALASARGGSPVQVRGLMALEGLLVGGVGAVAGYAAASLVNPTSSGWTEWVAVVLLGLAPAVLLAGTANTASRSTRSDLGRRGSRLRFLLEGVALALAALAVWRLFDRGLTGVSSTAEDADGLAVAQVDTGIDPLMSATPVLLALAACVLTLRLYPLPVRALLGLFRRRPGLTHFLGAARAVRDPAGGVIPALAVILGVSVAVLSTVLVATIDEGAESAVWRSAGADVRMSGPSWSDEVVEELRGTEGVAEVATIRSVGRTMDFQPADAAEGDGDAAQRGLTVYVVDSTLRQVQADTPLGSLPEALSEPGSPTPVLTGGQFTEDSGTGSLSGIGEIEIVGHLDALPGVRTTPAFLVVDREQWEAAGESVGAGEVLLASITDSAEATDVAAALNEVVPNALAETPQTRLDAFNESPVNDTMASFLVAAVLATTALTVLAVLFVQLMGTAARTSLFAVLRTLGLRQRQARALTAWELTPLVVMAVLVGAVLGVVVPWLLLQAIDLTGLTGGTVQPALAVDWATLGLVFLAVLGSVALAIAVSATTSGRADLTTQLRAGEER